MVSPGSCLHPVILDMSILLGKGGPQGIEECVESIDICCINRIITKRRLRDRVAEHRYALHTGNLNYPMAKHYLEAQHGTNTTLIVSGIEVISSGARGGYKMKRLKQREANLIRVLKGTSYLNEESIVIKDIMFSPIPVW